MSYKIQILKNKEIPLDIPHFSCDHNVLGDHLNEHPLTSLLNNYGFTCFIGKPQQGKTSLAVAFLTQSKPRIYKKTHHKVIVMMPQNSINSMKKNPFSVLPPENFYNELNEETLTSVYETLQSNTEQGLKTILLIDDMTASLKSSKHVEIILKTIVFNRRHLKCNILITSQSFSNIPLDLRKTITNVFIFKPAKMELEKLFEELVESKKDCFLQVMRHAFNRPHNFLFINMESQRMFANWDEMVVCDKEEIESKKII